MRETDVRTLAINFREATRVAWVFKNPKKQRAETEILVLSKHFHGITRTHNLPEILFRFSHKDI